MRELARRESKAAIVGLWTQRSGLDAAQARWRALLLGRIVWAIGSFVIVLMLLLSFGVVPRSPLPAVVFCVAVLSDVVFYALAVRKADRAARAVLVAHGIPGPYSKTRLQLPPEDEKVFESWLKACTKATHVE
jgi:hypothetical protein